MLPDKIAFVDIETTGSRSVYDKIIEIGILRVENNKIVRTYNSLLNPGNHLPPEITRLTGILPSELTDAPTFYDVKDEIMELLSDCIFVAHNVRFDYGFLKSEFRREEQDFSAKHFCTVKLSQLLFPRYKRHNLDAIIERFDLTCENRHRAYDDAKTIYDFYNILQSKIKPELLVEAVNRALKKPSIPLNLNPQDLTNLPESPGVYIFKSEDGAPLYIGKSINVKERVLSHFSSDIHSGTEMKISQQIKSIESISTAGELGALFLESTLIKEKLPLYNRQLRLKRSLVGVKNKKDKYGYERIRFETLEDIKAEDIKSLQIDPDEEGIVGFFKSQKQAKEYLLTLVKEYGLCEKLVGIENSKSACFGYRLGTCKGACVKKEEPLFYNLRFTTALSALRIKPWPFPGPIVIEETHPLKGVKEFFIIDKWCFLESVSFESDLKNEGVQRQGSFDLDTYKILKRFLLNPQNQKKIKLLKKHELTNRMSL